MKKLTIKQQILFSHIITGGLLILGGFMIQFENLLFTILQYIIIAILFGCVIVVNRAEKETDDEMSLHNLKKAKAKTIDVLTHLILVLFGVYLIFSMFTEIELKISPVPIFLISFGVIYASIGIFFTKYEKDGE